MKEKKKSCGFLIYRICDKKLEVLLCKIGGVFWDHKYANSWTFPKGEINEGESDIECAKREFYEETSLNIDFNESKIIDLGSVDSPNKINHIFAYEYDFNKNGNQVKIKSNTFVDTANNNAITPEVCENAYYYSIENAYRPLVNSLHQFLSKLKNIVFNEQEILNEESSPKNINRIFEKYCKNIRKNKNIISEPVDEEGEAGGMAMGGAAMAGPGPGPMPAPQPGPQPGPEPGPTPGPMPAPQPMPPMPRPRVIVMPLPFGAYTKAVKKKVKSKKKNKKK